MLYEVITGFSKETINNLENAFKIIFRSPNLLLKDALEQARADLHRKVAVGRRDDADVGADRRASADGGVLALLQHAQQAGRSSRPVPASCQPRGYRLV